MLQPEHDKIKGQQTTQQNGAEHPYSPPIGFLEWLPVMFTVPWVKNVFKLNPTGPYIANPILFPSGISQKVTDENTNHIEEAVNVHGSPTSCES